MNTPSSSRTLRVKPTPKRRRLRLMIAGGLSALLALVVACEPRLGSPSASTRRGAHPEVRDAILVTVDTLRADAPGYTGGGASTPLLDRLAAEGINFPNAHAHAVLTLPSHASLLTGRLPYEHGIRSNSGFVLGDEVPTLAAVLNRAGVATAAFVSAYPLDRRFGLSRGFEVYDDDYGEDSTDTEFVVAERRGDRTVSAARRWWDQQHERRRFLWLHLFEPHAPYEPPPPFGRGGDDPYLGEVSAADAFLGPLLEPILDSATPTLIILSSDHGEALEDHGELTHGLFAYEATLRVPLLLWAPGVGARVDGRFARHIDIAPTILNALGIDGPARLPGKSLLAISTPAPTYFESLDATISRGWAPLTGIIDGAHKYIDLPLPELYDLAADPAEARNLLDSGNRPAVRIAKRLRGLLPATRFSSLSPGAASDAESKMLESLGYLSGSAALRSEYTEADDPKRLVHLDRMLHQVIDFYQRRRFDQAAQLAREVIAKRPDLGVAYYHLSQVLLELGRTPEALAVLEQAQQRGVNTAAGRRQLALLLTQSGRSDEALRLIEPVAADGMPDDLNVLAVALSEAGRQETAHETLRRALLQDPDSPKTHQHLALVALRQGDYEQAEASALRALERNNGLPDAWNYLGVARQAQSQPRRAIQAWERALVLEPDNFDVLFNIGVVAAEIGDGPQARRALQRFLDEAPPLRYRQDFAKVEAMLDRLPGENE